MATDVAIVSRNVTSAPKTYTVPGAQEIRPKAVSAVFDCSGAAVTTFPALQLVSPAGDVVFTALDPSVSIAAGGSATVSWFPHVKGGTGSSPGTVNNAETAYVWGLAAGFGSIATATATAIQWRHFQTTDTTIFGTDTSAAASPPFHNAAGDSFLYFTKAGAYVAAGQASWAGGAYKQGGLVDNPGGQFQLNSGATSDSVTEEFATNVNQGLFLSQYAPTSYRWFYVDGTTGSGIIKFTVEQTSGVNKSVVDFNMGIMYLGGSTANLASIY